MTDVAGVVVWSADYTPFGIAIINEDPDGDGILVTNNFRFPGQYYDAETGLNYNYFRTYDPLVGRYTQSDPIGLRGGLNPFLYSETNPINLIDPLGLATYKAIVSFTSAGAIGGGAVMWGSVETECVNGKKQQGLLVAGFAGADVGLPVSSTAFTVKFSDNAQGQGDLHNLEGFSRILSLSGALGGGFSVSNIMLGNAQTSGNAGKVDAGGQLGFDLGAVGMSGWSNVLSISETACGCGK